jgi:hypothetical protein
MLGDNTGEEAGDNSSDQLYFIETFLRQRADHVTLLAVDALVLRSDVPPIEKQADLQTIIQGVLDVKR